MADAMAAEGGLCLQTAKDATNNCKLNDNIKKPPVHTLPAGSVHPSGIPLLEFTAKGGDLKWFVDLVTDVDPLEGGAKELVRSACVEPRLYDFPVPYGLKQSPSCEFKLQWALVPQASDK